MRLTKLSKLTGHTSSAVLALTLTSSAFADISAKKLGLGLNESLVYSELTLDHYLEGINKDYKSTKLKPRLRFSPVVGIKLFDEALDVKLTGFYDRLEDTTAVEQTKQAELLFESKEWDVTDFFSVQAFAEHKFASLGKDSSTRLGSKQKLSMGFDTKVGVMTPSLAVELGTFVHGKTQESDYAVDGDFQATEIESLGLRKDNSGEFKGNQKDQDFYQEWKASFAIEPAAVKELSVDLSAWLSTEYAPAYRVQANGKEVRNYRMEQSTKERLRLTYKINDQISLHNDFTAYQVGAFKDRKAVGENEYLNELGLIYKIL